MRNAMSALLLLVLSSPLHAQNCVVSGGTNFGAITQNCVVVGPSRLTFQVPIAEDLVRRVPKDKPVVIHSVGSGRDQDVATQYVQYLLDHGFKIAGRSGFGVKIPPADYPITIDDRGENVFVTIDPNVR